MNISITARKFKAHPTLKEYINLEVSSLTRFNESILSAEVILSFQNNKDSIKTAEIIMHVPGQILTAIEHSDDFKKSVGASIEKITRQLQKLKTKREIKVNDKAGF
jgi:putative sigma-54 modulation protein